MDFVEAAVDLVVLYKLGTLPEVCRASRRVAARGAHHRRGDAAASPRGPRRVLDRGQRWRTRPTTSLPSAAGQALASLDGRLDALTVLKIKEVAEPLEAAADAFENSRTGSRRSSSRKPRDDRLAIVLIVIVALAFDFTNGFHDAANAIATSISTRALTPRVALAMSAVLNLVGAFVATKVASTVGRASSTRRRAARPGAGIRRAARRDRVEPDHLVLRPAVVVVARPDRRSGRVGDRTSALERGALERRRQQGRHPDGDLTDHRRHPRVHLMLVVLWVFQRDNPHRLTGIPPFADPVGRRDVTRHGPQDAQKTMGVIMLALVTGGFHQASTSRRG